MNTFDILFKDPDTERQYRAIKRKTLYLDQKFYILLSIIICIFCLVAYIIKGKILLLICCLAQTIIWIGYFILRKASPLFINYLNTFASLIIYITALYSFIVADVLEKSIVANLFHGYYLASGQQLLQRQIMGFQLILTTHVLMFISRTVIIGSMGYSDLVTPSYFIQLAMDVFLIWVRYKEEIKDREVFKEFQDYRQGASDFKELLTNYLPQNIMIINRSLKPLFINKALQKTFGLSQNCAEDLYKDSKKLLNSLKVERNNLQSSNISACLEKLIQEQGSIIMREIVDYIVDTNQQRGSVLCFESFTEETPRKLLFQVTIFSIMWDREDAFAILMDDITDREEIIALKVADDNKDKVIATLSHELRTPLNGILGLIQMAEKRSVDSELSECLKLCKDSAVLLLCTINSMLDLGQIRQGFLKLNPSEINLKDTLQQIKSLFEFQCLEKNLMINIEIGKSVPAQITIDESRFKQILINLVGNALKFTFSGGIYLKVEEDKEDTDHLKVSVADTGVGISLEDRKNLFKMFGKLETNETVNKNGIGLGLTISESLARLLNNKPKEQRGICLESEVGKGSKFYFMVLKKPVNDTNEIVKRRKGTEDQYVEASLGDISLGMEDKLAKYEDLGRKESFISVLNNMHETNHNLTRKESPIRTLLSEESTFLKQRTGVTNGSGKILHHFGTNEYQRQSLIRRTSSGQYLNSSYSKKQSDGMNNTGIWVLVVDDNPFNLLVAQSLLEDQGCRVKTAFSGQSAIEMCKFHMKIKEPFRVIFMDCQMPVMDGYETTIQIRAMMKRGEIANAVILALTANNGEKDIERCYESGMDGHIIKPLKEKELKEKLSLNK